MPIKDVSNIRRPPRVGKIRLGIKAVSPKSGNEYPKAVDFFVVDPEDGITSRGAAESFTEVYGEKPREIDILFPCDDPAVFFPQWLKRYGSGSGLLCKGDGEKAQMVDRETGELVEIECNSQECEHYNATPPACRRDATLQFLLPRVSGLGVWVIDTTSFYSIVNLNSAVHFIQSITGGRIGMLPLTLRLRPQEVAPGGKKKTVYVLDLGHDHVTLQGILMASTKSPAAMLLPSLDDSKAPDDIYARSVREGTAQPAAQPARAARPAQAADDEPAIVKPGCKSISFQGPCPDDCPGSPNQDCLQSPAAKAAPVQAEVLSPEQERIETLMDQLKFTAAKKKALRAGYQGKNAELLAELESQAKPREAKAKAPTQTKPATPVTAPRPATAAAAGRSYF